MEITYSAEKTKNRKMAEKIFEKMKEFGFTPYDISYGNGYFIFNMGDDSVVHFRVKGVLKHWKFGLWLYSENIQMTEEEKEAQRSERFENRKKAAQLFVQWDTQIDKFKPAASDIAIAFDALDWMNYDSADERDVSRFMFNEMERMLRALRRHPLLAYHGGPFAEYQSFYGGSYLMYFLRNEFDHLWNWFLDEVSKIIFVPYMFAKCAIARKTKGVAKLEVKDFEKENPGWQTSYRYSIHVTFPEHTTSEQDEKWINTWFKKERYGRYRNSGTLFELSLTMRKIGVEDEIHFFVEDNHG